MSLSRVNLPELVLDSVRRGEYFVELRERGNPLLIAVDGEEFSLHVSLIHDSGHTRPNPDEVRIQVNRATIELQRERQDRGSKVAFIGFSSSGESFAAWDPDHVFSLEFAAVGSVYATLTMLEEATTRGFGVHEFWSRALGRSSASIALPSMALGFFLKNGPAFYASDIEWVASNTAHFLTGSTVEILPDAPEGDAGSNRPRFEYTRRGYVRDPQFTKAVLTAYGWSCCVCGQQMGLVEAAHILPHSNPDSVNSVQNGLALCVNHHRLYDSGLLLPGPNQVLHFGRARAALLASMGRARGLNEIEQLSRRSYSVPDDETERPDDHLLRRGISLRT